MRLCEYVWKIYKWPRFSEHLVEDQPGSPYVSGLTIGAPLKLFRRHVEQRPNTSGVGQGCVDITSEAEVAKPRNLLELTFVLFYQGHEHIRWLDVSVEMAPAMDLSQAADDVTEQREVGV